MIKKRIFELAMAVILVSGVFFLSREGARLVSNQTQARKTVVIDAGHGARDPGKIGTNDLQEKDVNLAVALKVQKQLEKEGVNVVMTRTDDSALYSEGTTNKKVEDMQKRREIIDGSKADCAVSIHQNSYSEESVKGAQVFYYQHSKEAKGLAEIVQQSLVDTLDKENSREAKGNVTYFLLKKTETPLVIVECGFLSNREESRLLGTEEYQDKIADAVCAGIIEYLSEK